MRLKVKNSLLVGIIYLLTILTMVTVITVYSESYNLKFGINIFLVVFSMGISGVFSILFLNRKESLAFQSIGYLVIVNSFLFLMLLWIGINSLFAISLKTYIIISLILTVIMAVGCLTLRIGNNFIEKVESEDIENYQDLKFKIADLKSLRNEKITDNLEMQNCFVELLSKLIDDLNYSDPNSHSALKEQDREINLELNDLQNSILKKNDPQKIIDSIIMLTKKIRERDDKLLILKI